MFAPKPQELPLLIPGPHQVIGRIARIHEHTKKIMVILPDGQRARPQVRDSIKPHLQLEQYVLLDQDPTECLHYRLVGIIDQAYKKFLQDQKAWPPEFCVHVTLSRLFLYSMEMAHKYKQTLAHDRKLYKERKKLLLAHLKLRQLRKPRTHKAPCASCDASYDILCVPPSPSPSKSDSGCDDYLEDLGLIGPRCHCRAE